MTLRVGFVGLGRMGLPVAQRLVDAGLDPLVHDVDESPRLAMGRQGARVAASVRAIGEQCDVIGVGVPADQHMRSMCEGGDGLFTTAPPGTVIAIHSTVRPATIVDLGRAAAGRGLALLDACISGGEAGAADGALVYMVGGAPENVDRCRPMFEATGSWSSTAVRPTCPRRRPARPRIPPRSRTSAGTISVARSQAGR